MAEYIDREQAKNKHCEICKDNYLCYHDKNNCRDLLAFNLMPSADVRENVHGEWIIHRGNWADEFECSVCHKVSKMQGNFCPNCGSRMVQDGKAD